MHNPDPAALAQKKAFFARLDRFDCNDNEAFHDKGYDSSVEALSTYANVYEAFRLREKNSTSHTKDLRLTNTTTSGSTARPLPRTVSFVGGQRVVPRDDDPDASTRKCLNKENCEDLDLREHRTRESTSEVIVIQDTPPAKDPAAPSSRAWNDQEGRPQRNQRQAAPTVERQAQRTRSAVTQSAVAQVTGKRKRSAIIDVVPREQQVFQNLSLRMASPRQLSICLNFLRLYSLYTKRWYSSWASNAKAEGG